MARLNSFNPAKDIPPLDGKIILITGGNIGLGKQTALEVAKHRPSEIWLAARDAEKANAALAEVRAVGPDVRVHFLKLDLSSFDSIKKAARTFREAASRLDILFMNAGVMGVLPSTTKEGYEMHWGVNHMGHALLLKLLLPLLQQTAVASPTKDVRVVFVSSSGHNFPVSGGIDLDTVKGPGTDHAAMKLYGQSKLANILYPKHCAKNHTNITFVSVHPGIVKTDLHVTSGGGGFVMRALQSIVVSLMEVSVEEGAKSQLWAAIAKDVESGEYYEPVGVRGRGSALSKDEELCKRLWDWTQKELEGHDV